MTNVEKAKKCGITWANQMFEDFSDPINRGKNFTWKNFPDMASRLAEVNCFMNFSCKVRNLSVLKKICKQSCKKHCELLIKQIVKIS